MTELELGETSQNTNWMRLWKMLGVAIETESIEMAVSIIEFQTQVLRHVPIDLGVILSKLVLTQ
jgi:hypothetical protein